MTTLAELHQRLTDLLEDGVAPDTVVYQTDVLSRPQVFDGVGAYVASIIDAEDELFLDVDGMKSDRPHVTDYTEIHDVVILSAG